MKQAVKRSRKKLQRVVQNDPNVWDISYILDMSFKVKNYFASSPHLICLKKSRTILSIPDIENEND